MTIITAGSIALVTTDLAGKKRVWLNRSNGCLMFKLTKQTYTLAELQAIMNSYETAEAAEPARLLAEKLARIRQEMAENGITESV